MKERQAKVMEVTPNLSARRKAQLLAVNRSSIYYQTKGISADKVTLMNEIRSIYENKPFFGYRKIKAMLNRQGYGVNNKRVLRLMQLMQLQAIYPKKNLSKRRQEDAVYPYLLDTQKSVLPNDCWNVDITYIKTSKGFVYLTALIDAISRKIMGWNLSIQLDTESCLRALEMALSKDFKAKIVNSDQGCQFTSQAWVEALTKQDIQISMDGKGRCLDNIPIERFWRTLKYEEVYLKTYDSVPEARKAIKEYIDWYNSQRPHQALAYQTPNEVFAKSLGIKLVESVENSTSLLTLSTNPNNHNQTGNIIMTKVSSKIAA